MTEHEQAVRRLLELNDTVELTVKMVHENIKALPGLMPFKQAFMDNLDKESLREDLVQIYMREYPLEVVKQANEWYASESAKLMASKEEAVMAQIQVSAQAWVSAALEAMTSKTK